MAIAGYTRPQLLIRQVLEVLPDPEERTLHAFSVGPQFSLHRYTNAAERAAMLGTAFVENADPDPDARQVVPYEGLEATQVVDQSFTRLYGEKLEGQVLAAQSSDADSDPVLYDYTLPSLQNPDRVKVVRRKAVITATNSAGAIVSASLVFGGSGYTPSTTIDQPVIGGAGSGAVIRMTVNASGVVSSVAVISGGSGYTGPVTFTSTAANTGANVGHIPDSTDSTPLMAELHGRPIKPADVVYTTYDGVTTRRIVKSVLREALDAHYGVDAGKANKQFAASPLNPTKVTGASFTNTSAPPSWATRVAYGCVTDAYVAGGGSGYGSAPTVTVSPPISIDEGGYQIPGEQAVVSATVAGGVVTALTVDVPGAGYYWGGVVAVNLNYGGSGYDANNPPKITYTGSAYVMPELEPVISGGQIVGVKIIEPGFGVGFGVGNFGGLTHLTVSGGAGSGAEIGLITNFGCARPVVLVDHGTGYDNDVTVDLSGAGSGFTAKAWFGANTVAIGAAGLGYAPGDIVELNVAGATVLHGLKTRVRVLTVGGGGAVTSVEIVEGYEGNYSGTATLPGATEPTVAITGSGNNALTISVTDLGIWRIETLTLGAGYAAGDNFTLTPSGAGGGASVEAAEILEPPTLTIAGSATGGIRLNIDPSDWSGMVEGSIYDGKYAERYTITVTKGGVGETECRARIRSASGAFSANSVVVYHYGRDYVINDPALGGLWIRLRPPTYDTPLRLGDVFTFVVGNSYTPLELAEGGRLIDIDVPGVGATYTNGTHDLVIAAPATGGVQAAARITITAGAIVPTSLAITNPGSGYIAPPTVTLPASAGTGDGNASLVAVISVPENDRDLTVVQSGVYTGPRDTQYQIKVVRGTLLRNTEDSFAGAVVRVSDSAGVDTVQEYTVTHGVQYPLGTHGLSFTFPVGLPSPSGMPAGALTATATASISGGAVVAVTITNPGDGYSDPPTVTFGSGTATAVAHVVAGKVVSVEITNPGSGYGVPPSVTMSAPTFYQAGLRTGDAYYIDAVAAANVGPYNTIELFGQAVDITGWTEGEVPANKFDIDVRTLFTGIITPRRQDPPNLAWEAGTTSAGGILVSAGLAIEATDRDTGYQWLPVKNATASKLFAHWRGLVPAVSNDTIRLFSNEEDIINEFGAFDMDNPACYAAIMAFRGGQEKPVFAAKLASNDLAGHQTLIRQAEHIDGIYSIVVTTYDQAIKEAWAAHVAKMSLENWKLWRRLYIATQNPGPFVVMNTKEDGTDYTATVTANASGNVRVICADGNFVTRDIQPGDLFRINFSINEWGDPTYEEYTVYTVNAEDELILNTGPAAPISPAIKFEVWRPDTGATQAAYAGEQSDAFMNRRVCNVWCDTPNLTDTNGQVRTVPVYYLAAEIAGLRAAVLPQQGLTYTELDHSLDAAPLMFTKYTSEELDSAAAMGTWIVAQEQEDGPLFIRHQLTTDTSSGILYYEDSIGVNVDNIAYAVKNIFQPYIGRRNVNQETLEEMETKMRDLLDGFKANPGGFSNIGPALITWRDLSITIDPVFKDRVNVKVVLELPLPMNTIIVTLMATTASDATVATINATVNAVETTV